MNDNNTTPVPTIQSDRITIIDSLRGFALLGILMMNIPFFSTPMSYHNNLNLFNEFTGGNFWCWAVVNGFFEGSMRALFSLLFGAGSILLLSRLEKNVVSINPADIFYRRLIWMFLFGMVNAFIFQWPGDILYAYSICGLFLFPFRNVRPARLIAFASVLLLIATLYTNYTYNEPAMLRQKSSEATALQAEGKELSPEQSASIHEWHELLGKNKKENVLMDGSEEIQIMQGGWITTFLHLQSINVMIQTRYMYKEYFLDVLMFFLYGMALFKWNVLTGKRSTKFYWGMFLFYIPGTLLAYWWLKSMMASNFDNSLMPEHMSVNLYHVRRICVANGHIGLIMLMYKYGIFKFLLRGLAAVGQMAFTNYLMQSIICTTIFYGFGFGLYGKLERYETYIVVVSVWIFQIIFSNIWLKHFRFGPFEWLWRSLTYWKKQPMKRNNLVETELI